MLDLLVTHATLPDGRTGQCVAVEGGRIVEIAPSIAGHAHATLDAEGLLLSPPFCDPHFHMDATLSYGLPRVNASGTLLEGIALWGELKPSLTADALVERALAYCDWAVAKGLLAIRTHVDTSDPSLLAVDGLLDVKRRVAPYLDLQLVAFPQDGVLRTKGGVESLERALDKGVDVVGGIPHFERTMAEGAESVRLLCEIAARRGLPVDMHCDESDDPLSRHIETLAAESHRLGLHGRVVGSHCTSMHSMDNYYVSKLLPLIAESGVSVIANPLINITLQGRHDTYPKRRGMTRVPELMAAGVNVAFGHDCVMDPWYGMGSGDMLEVAHMGLHVAQMTSQSGIRASFDAVTVNAARAMGLERYGLEVGCDASFVLLQARSAVEAIRLRAPAARRVPEGPARGRVAEGDGVAAPRRAAGRDVVHAAAALLKSGWLSHRSGQLKNALILPLAVQVGLHTMRNTGTYVASTTAGESVRAFVPRALPPARPALALESFAAANARAELALARLSGVSGLAPSLDWLLYSAVRKEALLTSQIEGTQATLTDLFDVEAGTAIGNVDDVAEVTNYLKAYRLAREQLHDPRGLPVSVRLLRDAHRLLLDGARGAGKQPGTLRRSQNWIGGTHPGNAAFVPPPADKVPALLADLERFIHDKTPKLPNLVRVALVHAQFETIHPFLDGNGRIGRLLIAALLEDWGLLPEPLMYLSGYLKQHQAEYHRRLAAVRAEGDWEGWVVFFLEGVQAAAGEAERGIVAVASLVAADRRRLLAAPKAVAIGLRLFELLPVMPRFTIQQVREKLATTFPTATAAVKLLEALGIVGELTGQKKNRTYSYLAYVELLSR